MATVGPCIIVVCWLRVVRQRSMRMLVPLDFLLGVSGIGFLEAITPSFSQSTSSSKNARPCLLMLVMDPTDMYFIRVMHGSLLHFDAHKKTAFHVSDLLLHSSLRETFLRLIPRNFQPYLKKAAEIKRLLVFNQKIML